MLLKHRRWHRCVCVIFFYIYIFGECLVIIVCWRAADLYPVSISRFSNLKIQWLLYTVRPDWLTVFLLSGQKSLRPHFYADRWMRTETFNTDKRLVNRFEEKLCWQCFKKKNMLWRIWPGMEHLQLLTSYFIFLFCFCFFLLFFLTMYKWKKQKCEPSGNVLCCWWVSWHGFDVCNFENGISKNFIIENFLVKWSDFINKWRVAFQNENIHGELVIK